MILMILNKKLMALLILIFLFLIIPISFASDIDGNEDIAINNDDIMLNSNDELTQSSNIVYVNSSSGTSAGTGSIDSPVSTIKEGLNLVGDGGTIYLTGEFIGDENSNITFEGSPNKIAFIGIGNAVINGNFTTSFAVVNNGEYSFKNISFINNYKTGEENEFGGVFYNLDGRLTFTDCLFENNSIYGVNRANGGVIDNSGTLIIRDCIFKNNSADVSNSSGFRKNSADGGAISNLGTLYVYDTTFAENKALRNGGAIRTQDGAKAYIENCNFTGNVAAYHLSGGSYGGAIYTWDCKLELYSSIFKDNKVYDASGYGAHGGAISINRGSGAITIQSCEFINNTADGIRTVDGQSVYITDTEVNLNYCTIDTSVYSGSQSVNLDYNWWVANNTNINDLIEMLPSSTTINSFAELKITSDVDEYLEDGETVNLTVKLCWNGTEAQDDINLIPTRTVYLRSDCGILSDKNGTLENGLFKTTITINNTANPIIAAAVDDVIVEYNFTKPAASNDTKLSATNAEIFEGDTAVIFIKAGENESGICLIDIDGYKYYAELSNGKGNASIPNLKVGKYDVTIKYLGNYFNKTENTTASITVKENNTTRMKTVITVANKFTCLATDYNAGERGSMFYAVLSDADGTPLANKTVQIATNGRVYNVTTDDQGRAGLQINLVAANTYTTAFSFQGDDRYDASPLVSSKLTVTKKSTSISANSKSFSAKAKTKKITVTLNTIKNKNNGKIYLKAGKKLTLKINGKAYTAKINSKGKATFTIKLTKKGKYTAKISFSGDKTYKASGKSIKITIK